MVSFLLPREACTYLDRLFGDLEDLTFQPLLRNVSQTLRITLAIAFALVIKVITQWSTLN